MTTITKKLTLFLHLSGHMDDYAVYLTDMSGYGYGDVLVTKQELEVEISLPEGFDKTNAKIEHFKAKQKEIGAEAQIQMNNIEGQIQSLLAIEDNSNGCESL